MRTLGVVKRADDPLAGLPPVPVGSEVEHLHDMAAGTAGPRSGRANLSLGRKVGQQLRLKMDGVIVWITILQARGSNAKVLIQAPRSVEVARGEQLS